MSHRLLSPALWFLLSLTCAAAARAEEAAPPPPCTCAKEKEEPPAKNHVEFSFGTSQLFVGRNRVIQEGETQLPTTSALLLAEWLGGERWSAMALFNLPFGNQRSLVGGQIVEKPAAPVLAVGGRWSPVRIDLFDKTATFEFQLAAMVGSTIRAAEGNSWGPLLGARLHLHNKEGFAIYVGGSWAFIRDSAALIYGIGNRF